MRMSARHNAGVPSARECGITSVMLAWSRLLPVVCLCFAFFPAAFAPAEELRAAWVASVANLNFPNRPGLSASAQQEQIRQIVASAAHTGLNALMVQVRPEGDALYASRIEPWSRFLTGTQGGNPGYDPLETFIEEGKRQGVAIHAWINPFRAASIASTPRTASHISRLLPSATHRVGSWLWMDPGDPAARQQVVRVVQDIVSRYAVAGVVVDDYFYPYPGSGLPRGTFPDAAYYARYQASGGDESLANWRRANIDALVRDLKLAISSTRSSVHFGVSPFGIYRPNVPEGIKAGVDQYADLYSDPVNWIQHGWVDYLSPQLYWPDGGPQSYSTLLRWWRSASINPRGVPIYPSIAVDRLGEGHNWPVGEIAHQLRLERSVGGQSGQGGFILFSMGPVLRNQKGVDDVLLAHAHAN